MSIDVQATLKTPSSIGIPDNVKAVMRRFVNSIVSKGVTGLLTEFQELRQACATSEQVNRATFLKNPDKNRYRDIPCIEESRVVLRYPPGTTEDYIHANWIKLTGLMEKDNTRQIICTQGPTKDTIPDFWRMIWQEKVKAILMLCRTVECGKKKCEQYWPARLGATMNLPNGMTVTNKNYQKYGKDMVYTALEITAKGSDGNMKVHAVNHVFWDGWPDKAVPLTCTGALRMIHSVEIYSPIVIHCSAGVGRTGTIVALETSLKLLQLGEELSVYNVVKSLRSQRFLCCQTDLQYLYIHLSLLAFIVNKSVADPEQTRGFVNDYEVLVNKRLEAGEK